MGNKISNTSIRVGVIGSGSWGTAIIQMLTNNLPLVNWWVRNPDTLKSIELNKKNPKYLSNVNLDLKKLNLNSDINIIVNNSDYLVLAVPSAFLVSSLNKINDSINKKIVFSAIKGIVPEKNTTIGAFLNKNFNIPYNNIGVITGPCHAEEVALKKLSYLTIACPDLKKSKLFASVISCNYINTIASDDIYGTEYSSILKNIVSIAVGISIGLGYGDNFRSVLVSNAIREIKRFVDAVHPINRDINESAYLGDLLVTSYSKFSRNRIFGEFIGRGLSIKESHEKLKMIAEGYFSVKCINKINESLCIDMPITSAVYNILYNKNSVKNEIQHLSQLMS